MSVSRRFIVVVLALLVLASATIVQADQGKTTEKQHMHETISFTMQPGPEGCPALQTALNGTGESDTWLKITTFANGSRQVVDDREVNGKVVDSSGKSRKFQYLHHAILSQSPDGTVVHIDMTDSFIIKEKERKNLLEVRFHWLWTYTPADPTAVPTVATMSWPPVDAWVQLESGGDPLHCDPL